MDCTSIPPVRHVTDDEPGEKFLLCLIDRGSARFAAIHTASRLVIVRESPTAMASFVEFAHQVWAAVGLPLATPAEPWKSVVERAQRGELPRILQRDRRALWQSSPERANLQAVRVPSRLGGAA